MVDDQFSRWDKVIADLVHTRQITCKRDSLKYYYSWKLFLPYDMESMLRG